MHIKWIHNYNYYSYYDYCRHFTDDNVVWCSALVAAYRGGWSRYDKYDLFGSFSTSHESLSNCKSRVGLRIRPDSFVMEMEIGLLYPNTV